MRQKMTVNAKEFEISNVNDEILFYAKGSGKPYDVNVIKYINNNMNV